MREAINQRTALWAQLTMIAGSDRRMSFLEVRYRRVSGGMGQDFIPIAELDRAARAIVNRGQTTDLFVGCTPRVARRGSADAVARAWCVWVDCDSEGSVERLREFRPLPSIVIGSGSSGHLHCYWPLSHPLLPSFAKRANLRLAHALGADRACADVARVLRPAGTFNFKHEPPRRVRCVRCKPATFRMPEVVGHLADDPLALRRLRPRPSWLAGDRAVGLDGVARVVREAPLGERNRRLFWAACRLGEKIAASAIGQEAAEELLLREALSVGLTEAEAQRTIRSGLETGGAA